MARGDREAALAVEGELGRAAKQRTRSPVCPCRSLIRQRPLPPPGSGDISSPWPTHRRVSYDKSPTNPHFFPLDETIEQRNPCGQPFFWFPNNDLGARARKPFLDNKQMVNDKIESALRADGRNLDFCRTNVRQYDCEWPPALRLRHLTAGRRGKRLEGCTQNRSSGVHEA